MKKLSTTKQLNVPDLTELLRPYPSGWVALSSDEREVIAAGGTLREAREQATQRGAFDAVFVKVIPPDQGYLPAFL